VSGVPAGWYDDPLGEPGERYWDGDVWTERTRPWRSPEAVAAATGPAVDGTGPSRRGPLMVAGTVLVAVVAVAAVVLTGAGSPTARGAASPTEAVEEFAVAIGEGRFRAALGLVAPDEIDWLAPIMGDLAEGLAAAMEEAAPQQDLGAQFGLRVTFGAERPLADGVTAIAMERVVITPLEGELAEVMRAEAGGSLTFGSGDLFGLDLVAVERGSGWYVSPIGTGLERFAAHEGLPGAGPARPRPGADSPERAADEMFAAFGSFPLDAVDLLDPEELRILDHYRPLFNAVGESSEGGRTSLQLRTTPEGGDRLRVDEVTVNDGDGPLTLDLSTWCWRSDVDGCLADELRDEAAMTGSGDHELTRGEESSSALWRGLLEPTPLQPRLGFVERDGRSYLSLAGTSAAFVAPLVERAGGVNVVRYVDEYLGLLAGLEAELERGRSRSLPAGDLDACLEETGGDQQECQDRLERELTERFQGDDTTVDDGGMDDGLDDGW
jgi:hypothetical protein